MVWFAQLLGAAPRADAPVAALPLHEAPPDTGAAPTAESPLHKALSAMAGSTRERIDAPELGLPLLLPEESRPLPERAAALCDWVRGFLYGMGLVGVAERDLSAQTREVLKDFAHITRMDLDAVAEDEESETALSDLTEFVWVAALLVREDRMPARGEVR